MANSSTIDLLQELIAFDTTSHRSNLELIGHVEGYLQTLGIGSERVTSEDGRKANLLATIGPIEQPGVILSGHTDVVPVDGQDWHSDPFRLERRDHRLYGRGTADMKTFIAAALAFAPRFRAAALRQPIHFCFSYDEEVGCRGVRPLIERLQSLPVRPRLCIVGEPTGMEVIIGHKGKLAMRCRVRGLAAHSSLAPQGVNAVEYAAAAVARLQHMARRIARAGPFDESFDIPHTTLHTGLIRGGTALNIVPEACEFEFECRYLPDDDPQVLLAELRAYVRAELEPAMQAIAAETGFEWQEVFTFPGLNMTSDHPAVTVVARLAQRNTTARVAYGTEAGLFQRDAGIPTVVCGPGHIAQAHKPNEHIELEQIERVDAFMDRLLAYCCE